MSPGCNLQHNFPCNRQNMPGERTDPLPGAVSEALTNTKRRQGGARDGEDERRRAEVQSGLGRVETGLASQAAQRAVPATFRLALADAQRYDDVIGNFPV